MKIRKYGYTNEFIKPFGLRFAVMIQHIEDDGTQTWRFITEIDWINHRWKAVNKQPAYLFNTRVGAQDFCIELMRADMAAYVVEVLESMEFSNNW